MPRLFSICLLALSAVALLAASPATAAKKRAKASTPSIARVQPMRVSVGGKLTISGRNFKAKRSKNTVIFRSTSGRTAFAKPRRASRRKLVVVVPAAVSRLLTVDGGRQKPTRLRLRVLAGKFSKYTTRRLSPVVTGTGTGTGAPGPGGGGAAGAVICDSDADHDNDLLNNGLELLIGTDPCLGDTDSDGMIDGWEYWSAKDLNIKALPYPGSRPFPNALDPSDGGPRGATSSKIDFDGDGLTTLEEYRAWTVTGRRFDATRIDRSAGVLLSPPDLQSALNYSDGTKFSRDDETPSNPAWRSGGSPDYGLPHPSTYFAYPSVSTSTVTSRGATTSATRTPTGSQTGWSPLGDRARTTGGRASGLRRPSRSSPGRRSPTVASVPVISTSGPSPISTSPTATSTATVCSTARTTRTTTTTPTSRSSTRSPTTGTATATRPGACGAPA